MKKLIIGVMLTIAVLCLAACGGSSVKVGSFSSLYFNEDDYDNAVQEVFTYFSDWEGCTMTEIGYAGDDAVKAEAEIRGLAPEVKNNIGELLGRLPDCLCIKTFRLS